jgi:serine protease Do
MSGLSVRPSSYPNRLGSWRHIVVVVAAVLLSVLGVGSAVAQPQPGADQGPPVTNPQAKAADLVQPGVVFVRVHYDAWVVTDLFGRWEVPLDYACSGFIVNPNGYIVTAGHCLQDDMEGAQGDAVRQVVDQLVRDGDWPDYLRDQLIADVLVGNVDWRVEGVLAGTKPERQVSVVVGGGKVKFGKVDAAGTRPAQVKHEPDKDYGDVALLKVDRKGLPAVLLSPTDDIEVGEELLSIGYPAADNSKESFGLTNRNGQVNSEITKGSGNHTYYETSASLSEGMSGGPTTDLVGQVVGLASFKNEDANYIVPASIIREMLNSKNVANELGTLDELYRKGLESLYRGAHSAAIKDFDQVLALMPGHRLAQAKKTLAAERREKYGDPPPPPPPDEPGPSTTVLLGAAAGVLVVLAITAGLVLRRRSGKPRRGRRGPPAPEPLPLAGYASEQGDDPDDLPRMATAEVTFDDPQPARTEAVLDPALGDGSVRDRARTATSVSVWDREAPAASPPDAEPARRTRNFCSTCGTRVRPDDLSCLQCGARLD